MATIHDEALCIRHWDWSETSQTVSLFTREHGLVRGLAKGSKREKAPFSGGIEVLTRGEVVAITRASGALATLTAWDLIDAYPVARRSLRAFHVGLYLLDLLHHGVTDEDPHPGLYDDLLRALAILATDSERALGVGQWAMLVETGYRPVLERDVRTGEPLPEGRPAVFLPRLGGLAAGSAAGDAQGWQVRWETVLAMRTMDSSGELAASAEATERVGRLLGSYLRFVLGHEVPSAAAVFGEGRLSN
ncbi:MAG: DNA repair protein RecO [Phycisphaerales bacterium]|nr:DNA repair protein RecO [Phycisphaerales bacterium]